MKKILLLLLVLLVSPFTSARELDFTLNGDKASNEILTNFLMEEIPSVDFEVVSYFFDFDSDGQDEILGIIKSNLFYNLKGYKLFVLTKKDNFWIPIHSDINFDNSKPIVIEDNKIIYFGGALYDGRKYTARLKNGEIKTSDKVFEFKKNKHIVQIEEVTNFEDGAEKNKINLNEFNGSKQKPIEVYYKYKQNRKHYFEVQ